MRSHGNVAYLKNVQLKRLEGREGFKGVIKIVFVPEYTFGTPSPPPPRTSVCQLIHLIRFEQCFTKLGSENLETERCG